MNIILVAPKALRKAHQERRKMRNPPDRGFPEYSTGVEPTQRSGVTSETDNDEARRVIREQMKKAMERNGVRLVH